MGDWNLWNHEPKWTFPRFKLFLLSILSQWQEVDSPLPMYELCIHFNVARLLTLQSGCYQCFGNRMIKNNTQYQRPNWVFLLFLLPLLLYSQCNSLNELAKDHFTLPVSSFVMASIQGLWSTKHPHLLQWNFSPCLPHSRLLCDGHSVLFCLANSLCSNTVHLPSGGNSYSNLQMTSHLISLAFVQLVHNPYPTPSLPILWFLQCT
jgi:hypothetical protein